MNAKNGGLIAGNWKSVNMTTERAVAWADGFGASDFSAIRTKNLTFVVFPPMSAAYVLRQALLKIPSVKQLIDEGIFAFGGQDIDQVEGPKVRITGSHHPNLLADLGMTYVLIGHSERRSILGEDNDAIAKKLGMAFAHTLTPILCVGENRAEYDAKQTHEIIKRQLSVLNAFPRDVISAVTVAYEPVWAIGTGLTPTPKEAGETCGYIASLYPLRRVIYGGSVTATNAPEFFSRSEIDGALPGGASENAVEFFGIAQAASHLL